MGRLPVLSASAAVASLANAFCVDFNSGERCTGQVVGKFIGGTGTGCQTAFAKANSSESVAALGAAFDVVIQPESNDTKSGVACYAQPDCEYLIGFGNVPLCTGVGAWSSFQVIPIEDADNQVTNLDPAPILSIPANATASVGQGERLPTSTGMPQDTPDSAGTTDTSGTTTPTSEKKKRRSDSPELSKRVAHGSIHQHQGRTYKYQQVAARAWRGVPVEEWNDQVHKRDTRDLAPSTTRRHARAIGRVGGDSANRGISLQEPSPLQIRDIDSTKCNLVRSCMIDTGDNQNFGIAEAGPALLRALETANPDGTPWQFLRQPFIVEVTDGTGQSLGLVYAQTDEHAGVASCVEPGSEAQAFKSALDMGVAGSMVTDMRVDLKLRSGEGVTNTLFVSTKKAGSASMDVHPIC
ncbi:MAG: hypothetical protein Q9226_003318 [Calogaya cf. arnoldii]